MTQHSTRAASPPPSTSRRGRLLKRSWPARLVLVAALLLAVPFLFDSGSTVHAADNEITGVTVTSLNPGEIAITWDAPSRAPSDYRVTWKKSDGKWPSYKNDNTVEGGNAFPTGTSHTVSALEEGTEYSVRVRARYHNSEGNVEESGPWSDPHAELTVSAQPPPKKGEGDSNEGRSTSPPAKPQGLLAAAMHNSVSLFWTDPGDDTITGYQILRGPDAANLAVLTEDTGSTDASYSDDTVEAETTYAYAIRARNAAGLGPQSDTVSVTTQAAPEELLTEMAVVGVEFSLDGHLLDTTGTCTEGDITQIADACTINIETKSPVFAVDGTVDSDDRIFVRTGRNAAAIVGTTPVADADDLRGVDQTVTLTFPEGRTQVQIWADEDEVIGGSVIYSYRVNVVPYWEWNGNTLSKDSDCRDTTANAPAVGEITDADCIVAPKFGNTAELRFFNVINEHFNVYVEVNGTNVISEPSTTDLGNSFTVNLDAGDNLIRIRLAAKGGQPTGEVYDSDSFYYKVTTTDVLVSNLGQTGGVARLGGEAQAVTQFTTGRNPNGYTVNKVRLPISVAAAAVTPVVSIYSDVSGSPGTSIKTLTNPAITVSTSTAPEAEFDADDYKLNASTPYWIVVENPHSSEELRISLTLEDSEDAGGAPGWSIGNVSKSGGIGTLSDLSSSEVMQIGIKGALATGPSDDATLSDLVLFDSTSTEVTLVPAFDSEVTEYTATVANEHTRGALDAQLNDVKAGVEFLDENDATIPTAGVAGDVRYINPNFDVGDNIFKIKVTAEDTTSTKTYQVTVTRSAAAPDAPASLTASPGNAEATLTWTEPASDGGAAITKYQYRVSVDGGSTWSPDWTDVPDGSDTGTDQADERTVTVTSLTNGTLHTFQVRAVNSEGSGIEAEDTATPATQGSTTLTALVLKDASANTITINPTFAYDVESYNATVANSVDQITVEPTKFDNTSTIKYLDSNDMELTDADATTTGVFDVDLAEGENVIKVEVTSSDAMTKTTYTVRVRRTAADDLVSNLGQPDYSVIVIFPNAVYAMQFTSGTNIAGYTISGVVVNIVSNTSGTFAFAIHETDSTGAFDVPGNKVVDLTGSPTMLGEHTFIPATTTQLDPSTEYFIVITKTSGSATEIQVTLSEEEDLVAETGWTIEDSVFSQNSGSTWAVASAGTPEFAVKGEPITPIITLAADFTSIVRELHEVTFTLTRAGSTAQAADVTLVVENASGDSVVSTSGRTETLTFAANDDTVEFAVPLSWIRAGRPTGSFVATVEAPVEYDTSAATATVEVVNPSGTLIEAKLDQNSYNVTEGNDLTFNLVFNVLEEIAAPNRDLTNILSVNTVSGTAAVNDDFAGISAPLQSVPANSWGLVSDRYVATVSVTLETVDDALYERPMGAHESLELELQGAGGTPPWVTRIGPTTGTTRYPVTITDDETLNLSAELSSTGLTAGQNLRIDEDAGQDVTLTVTNSDLASDGNPVTLPPGVKLKITPDIPMNRGATETDDWTISPVEIDLGGTATITIIDDMLEEGPESVTFEVGFDDDAAFQAARATLTINDDEYTGPVLQSAAIDGRELTLEFSNTLDATSRPAASSFVVKVRGAAVSLSSSNPVSISGSTVTLRLGSPVTAGDTVTVSYTEPGANPIQDGDSLAAPSFTDEPVTNNTPNAEPTGKPVISGTPQRGQTLTASTSGIRDDDGLSNPRYSYRWLQVETGDFVNGPQSYLLTRDDIGKKIKVIVGFFDDAGQYHTLESDAFPRSGTIQNKPNRQPTGRPALSGTYQVGHTLTADTSGIDDQDGLTNPGYTYQWQRREIGVYTDISGADSMVYTLTADDQGKRVRVQVTFTDDDENVHTLESFPSGVVQAQTSIPSDKVKVSLDATAYVVEEGETIRVTVTLAEAPEDERVIIPFTVTPANGASRSDFAAWSSYTRQLRFDVGDTTDRINVHANDDTLNDDGETLTLCLGDLPEPYATLAGLDCATINIMDNDDPNSVRVTFRSDTYWASEDGNPAWPRISVHPVPDREITIPITFTRGGRLSEDDYEIVTTSVTFGPGLYGVHGDGHLSDNRTYASFPIEIWAIDDDEDDDGEYMDLAFGDLPPFVSAGGTGKFSYRPTTARVWFNDNEFTEVSVTDPPNPLGFSKRMRVSFADEELDAKEGQYSNGCVATVRVRLDRRRDMESRVIIPIVRNLHGGATDGVDFAAVPDYLVFAPGQTEHSFPVRPINDDIDDDGEYVTFSFGTLPDDLVYVRGEETTRVNLVDDDDPPVDVFFEQANYEVTNVIRDGDTEYARLNVKVKLSAAPERFIDVGIIAESIQGGGGIHFEYSAYIPRGPHDGAHFYADDTEFTLQVYISARGGFDANQTYRLSFKGMSYKMFVGSPATATITINAGP